MNDLNLLINLLLFLFAIQSDLIMISYYGQQIMDEVRFFNVDYPLCIFFSFPSIKSFEVVNVIYSMSWYTKNDKIKKLLLFSIIRAQKQTGVTAGKFFYMSFESYYAVNFFVLHKFSFNLIRLFFPDNIKSCIILFTIKKSL